MTSAGQVPEFDTVILAGGSASRMGGADKAALAVGATPMLVSVAAAAFAAGTSRLILVGPPRPGSVHDQLEILGHGRTGCLTRVQEEPAGAGPAAGLRRGLAEAAAPWLLLLAADLPFLTGAHLTALLSAGGLAADGPPDGSSGAAEPVGVVAVDLAGRPQWLMSCWRISVLRPALAAYDGGSLRGVLAPLNAALIRLETRAGGLPPWLDCDTPDDLATARRAWLARAEDPGG